MDVSPLDDYPIHQVPLPVRYVATSDRNCYDRYYFNIQDPTGQELMIFGLGVYPNLGVMDAFAGIRVADNYRVVRASRRLGSDPADTTVGPLKVQVLAGLKELRICLEPNEWDLEFELTWRAATAAHFESQRFRRDAIGRVSHDQARFNQVGTWQGHLTYGAVRRPVDEWVGIRDKSWGVRPVGEPEPERLTWPDVGGQPRADQFWNYSAFLFPDYSIVYICEEDGDGMRTMQDATRTPRDGGAPVSLGRPEHELDFFPGTRRLRGGRVHLTEPTGEPIVLEFTARTWVPTLLGSGYRPYDHWRHGKDQGPELVVEGLDYDLESPELQPLLRGDKVMDSSVHCRIGNVDGSGTFELGLTGRNDRYGFADADSMAPVEPSDAVAGS